MAENSTAFDSANPPLKVTNPGGMKHFQEYPRHLHDAHGNHVTVEHDADKAARLAEGWFLTATEAIAADAAAKADAVADGADEKPKRGKAAKADAAAA